MNENNINEYIKNLPEAVQDIVFDYVWEERTVEIGKKYGLKDDQVDQLANIVVLVLIGIEKPETFLQTVMADLGISNLLAEQILTDLENRVFDYALKEIESSNQQRPATAKVLEVKPDNLPAIEIGEVAHDTPPGPRVTPLEQKPLTSVQKPTYGVPKFGMGQVEPKVQVINMNQNKPVSPTVPESKPQGNVLNVPPEMQKKMGETPKMPTTKYDSDPYREPIK